MVKVTERIVFTFVVILLLFMLLNFDPRMGQIFALMALASVSLYLLDKKIAYPIERHHDERLKSIFLGVGGYFIFIISSTLILQFLKLADITGINSMIEFFSQYLSTFFAQFSPALADNPWLILLGWGILIPITESVLFFGRLFEAFTDFWNVNVKMGSISTWIIIFLTSGIFALFHISAKGITNNAALIMVFMFGVVSVVLVVFRKQLIEAIVLHIVANSSAVLVSQRIVAISPLIISIMVGLVLYLILQFKITQKIIGRF